MYKALCGQIGLWLARVKAVSHGSQLRWLQHLQVMGQTGMAAVAGQGTQAAAGMIELSTGKYLVSRVGSDLPQPAATLANII